MRFSTGRTAMPAARAAAASKAGAPLIKARRRTYMYMVGTLGDFTASGFVVSPPCHTKRVNF